MNLIKFDFHISFDRCRYLAVFEQAYIYPQGKISKSFLELFSKQKEWSSNKMIAFGSAFLSTNCDEAGY